MWFDANANGVYEPGTGEYGIGGVSVALALDANNNGQVDAGEIIATDVTDASGLYLFTGLPAGTYIVRVTDTDNVLGGFRQTFDADGLSTPQQSKLTLGAGATNLLQDFGYVAAGQQTGKGLIGDTVFLDANNSGYPDAGEAWKASPSSCMTPTAT